MNSRQPQKGFRTALAGDGVGWGEVGVCGKGGRVSCLPSSTPSRDLLLLATALQALVWHLGFRFSPDGESIMDISISPYLRCL